MPAPGRPVVLIASFPEGHTGPHAFLRSLLANATFRETFDVDTWHVPDLYRGVRGKLKLLSDARARLRASGADVVYLNLDLSLAFWLCVAFRLAGARRVVTRSLNSVFSSPASRLGRYVYRAGISALAHGRVAISEEAARAMYVRSPAGVSMIPCLIDFEALHADAAGIPARSRGVGERFVFGCVGRLAPQKNQALAIRALALLRRQGLDVELLLVGEGRDRDALASLAAGQGVEDRVTFMGVTDRVGAVYHARIDALLVPSAHEGQGRIVAEAQSFGLPVAVSHAVPRVAMLTSDGVIADLPLDVHAWAAAMRGLMDMPRRPAWSLLDLDRQPISLVGGVQAFCEVLHGHAPHPQHGQRANTGEHR